MLIKLYLYMDYEKRKEKLRNELGEVGYTDLDINLLSSELRDLYYSVCESSIHEFPELKSIYIVGSFATNTAIKSASDIDIRFVVYSEPTKEQCEWLNDYITYNWKDCVSSQNHMFGYVDANVNNTSPPKPHINIYENI